LKIRVRLSSFWLAVALLVAVTAGAAQDASTPSKRKVNAATDLPRFSYPVASPPSVLLTADDATFNAFADRVLADVNSVLDQYDIEDKSTLRQLYAARLSVQALTGNNQAALTTLKALKALQEKPKAE